MDEFNDKLDAAEDHEKRENLHLPAFTQILADKSVGGDRLTAEFVGKRKIPLLLDIPGTGSEFLTPVLEKCLGVAGTSKTSDFRALGEEVSYVHTNSSESITPCPNRMHQSLEFRIDSAA